MWLKISEVEQLGIFKPRWVRQKIQNGEWRSRETSERGRNGKPIREVELESLPHELQLRWATTNAPTEAAPDSDESSLTTDNSSSEDRLTEALMRYAPDVREAMLAEAQRLLSIVESYDAINPKREKINGKLEFVPAVHLLCDEAVCHASLVLGCEPKRKKRPSPLTLDGWARKVKTDGLLTFIRQAPTAGTNDGRKFVFSAPAAEFVERNLRACPSPRHLFTKYKKEAKKKGWEVPSESYFYRQYSEMPKIVKALIFGDRKTYQSKFAPYVPRDFSDLEALQVLCGDHSVRDVSLIMPDGSLWRVWLTLWLCLRTYTIWGRHLDIVPSSRTIGLAYADGCRRFGAQPIAQPDINFYSYLYTDWGKDYRCLDLNGRTLTFKNAAQIDGSLQIVTTQRRVGLMDELGLKHLLARAYNAKEKPVERIHKDISFSTLR